MQKPSIQNLKQNKTLYIFSLGNPGEEYKYTRHNAGRIVCDEILTANDFEKLETEYSGQKKAEQISDKVFEMMSASNNYKLTIKYFEPDTYMNLTGKFIRDKMKNAKDGSVLAIVYDDIDIDLGEVKLSYGRSAGGHNGVESVINVTGTKDFYRVRVGIGGKPIKEMMLQDYVISKLKKEEISLIKNTKSKVLDRIREIVIK